MNLFPEPLNKPIVVKEAFSLLKDNKNERINLPVSSKTYQQMQVVKPGARCKIHHSHHRLSMTKVAPTIDRGGGAGAYHIWHPIEHRPITTLELKRLQSYSDEFRYFGNVSDFFERIGNSVPPLFMKAIAAQIKHVIWGSNPLAPYPEAMNYLEILENAWQDHLKPKEPDAPTVISLFAGGGGSSLGYSMAGYRELLAVEWNDNAVATFKLNFPDVPVYHGDIAKLSVDECMKLAGLTEPGQLDLLDGSPPCQGFSSAGKRILNDPRNQLFREYVRLLRGLQPKVFVMENVSGLVKGKMKLVFAEIMRELKASGYQVKCQLMNTKYFYVPQSRERLIFIGVRNDLEVKVSYPQPISRPTTVKEAFDKVITGELKAPSPALRQAIKTMIPGKGGVNGLNQWLFNTKRLSWNKPSNNIVKDHVGSRCGLVHPEETRLLGTGEFQRLGGYPDQFQFVGKYDDVVNRIGNSVPPLFMRAIASHIKTEILAEYTLTGQEPALLSE